jgi:DtxR family manganese transport transcriptional regulator
VVDLTRRLGVMHVIVNRTLALLRREGFVRVQPHPTAFLTESGRTLAEACRHRRGIVIAFLVSLGIPDKTAGVDAEGIEHHLSPATLAAFARPTK